MMLLFVANARLTVSEFAGIGGAMEIFGVSRYIAVPIALAGIWAVTVLGNYSRAERVFLVMGLVFLTYPIAALLGQPNLGDVVSNLLWPHFVHSQAFLFLAVALIGTTITLYMQFYLTSAVLDRGVTPTTYRGERIGTVNGTILGNIVSVFHHHRHRNGNRRQRAAHFGRAGRRSAQTRRGRRRITAVRDRFARSLAARSHRRRALDCLRHLRDRRTGATVVAKAPRL